MFIPKRKKTTAVIMMKILGATLQNEAMRRPGLVHPSFISRILISP
jgi:hypothetical protein